MRVIDKEGKKYRNLLYLTRPATAKPPQTNSPAPQPLPRPPNTNRHLIRTERVTSERRANTNFKVKCESGSIDQYVTRQYFHPSTLKRSGMMAATRTGMGTGTGFGTRAGVRTAMGTERLHSTVNDSGHRSMRSTGGSSGFGGASLVARIHASPPSLEDLYTSRYSSPRDEGLGRLLGGSQSRQGGIQLHAHSYHAPSHAR